MSKSRIYFGVLKFFLALMTASICWEIVLTNFVFRTSGHQEHPVIGKIPAQKAGIYLQTYEGYCQTQINSLGLRGPELMEKRPGEFRVLVLGDSYTVAFQVAEDATFVAVAQARASRILGRRVTVINAGKEGINPAYFIHLAPTYRTIFSPDLTVVQVNDRDFYFEILEKGLYYVKRRGGGFETIENGEIKSGSIFLQRFPQLDFNGWIRDLSLIHCTARSIGRYLPPGNPIDDEIRILDLMPQPELEAAAAWSLRALKLRYGRVVILHVPSIHYKHPEVPIHKMEVTLARLAREAKLDLIPLRSALESAQAQKLHPVRGFWNTIPGEGHLNEFGHAIVGQRLADYIVSEYNR